MIGALGIPGALFVTPARAENQDRIVLSLTIRGPQDFDRGVPPVLQMHASGRALLLTSFQDLKVKVVHLDEPEVDRLLQDVLRRLDRPSMNTGAIQQAIDASTRPRIAVSDAPETGVFVSYLGQEHRIKVTALDSMAAYYPEIQPLAEMASLVDLLLDFSKQLAER